jgi:tetratricopeptide (TPR) repeat protein
VSLSFAQRLCNRTLDTFWSLGAARSDTSVLNTSLCALLRRFPFWLRGHKLLAESALTHDDVGQAYAASQCYRVLAQGDVTASADAAVLVGRCFLRRGEWRTALGYLLHASELAPHEPRVQEEVAAAYILGGDYAQALSQLNSIPIEQMSAEGKAALSFVRTKCS